MKLMQQRTVDNLVTAALVLFVALVFWASYRDSKLHPHRKLFHVEQSDRPFEETHP